CNKCCAVIAAAVKACACVAKDDCCCTKACKCETKTCACATKACACATKACACDTSACKCSTKTCACASVTTCKCAVKACGCGKDCACCKCAAPAPKAKQTVTLAPVVRIVREVAPSACPWQQGLRDVYVSPPPPDVRLPGAVIAVSPVFVPGFPYPLTNVEA